MRPIGRLGTVLISSRFLDVRKGCLESLNIWQLATKDETLAAQRTPERTIRIHSIDFAVDPSDLNVKRDADWNYKDKLNLCFITFDRYAHIYSNRNREASYLCFGGRPSINPKVGPGRPRAIWQ